MESLQLALALTCVASIGLSMLLVLRLQRLKRRLPAQAVIKEEPRTEPMPEPPAFAAEMKAAEMKARLTEPPVRQEPPERYRYAAAMARRGMPAAEIAGVLRLPLAEAEQLVALARVGERK